MPRRSERAAGRSGCKDEAVCVRGSGQRRRRASPDLRAELLKLVNVNLHARAEDNFAHAALWRCGLEEHSLLRESTRQRE